MDIDAETNTIVVGGNEDLLADGLVADDINWVGIAGVQESRPVLAKIRYNMEPVPATLQSGERGRRDCCLFRHAAAGGHAGSVPGLV